MTQEQLNTFVDTYPLVEERVRKIHDFYKILDGWVNCDFDYFTVEHDTKEITVFSTIHRGEYYDNIYSFPTQYLSYTDTQVTQSIEERLEKERLEREKKKEEEQKRYEEERNKRDFQTYLRLKQKYEDYETDID